VIDRIEQSDTKDWLSYKTMENANHLYTDPCPQNKKQLRLRYRINKLHANLVIDFNANGMVAQPFLFVAPKQRFLKIISAKYGHPKGASTEGRMSFDVR
jgi:hypothetical protein